MTHENTLLGLLAQSSIHAGTGQNTGVIDLPIQREGHNGWPCVFGSAVKGAMRASAEQENAIKYHQSKKGLTIERQNSLEKSMQQGIEIVFGPDTQNAGDFASAVMISDARLLLFPVRSLSSQFKWVTCPAVLARLSSDRLRFGFDPIELDAFSIHENQAIAPKYAIASKKDKSANPMPLYLEEYRFELQEQCLDNTLQLIKPFMSSEYAKAQLKQQLLIVSNDNFSYLVQHATPVNAHIAIESATKTVRPGALWYEETLPPETLLYIGISAVKARNGLAEWSAKKVLALLLERFEITPWLQIGGNETVGMGWCAVCDIRDSGDHAIKQGG